MNKTEIEKKLDAILEKAHQTKTRLKNLEPEIKQFETDVAKFVTETEKPRPKIVK
ncbi:MAG: hypothetical protein MUF43_10965 [Flavobacterium sp.]|jgi:peptidoglycan hydrolase CwlO-like protein|nr:hypothetical protein [Flavobacterium sp.]